MFHIYKITNILTNKIYIGYYYGESNNLKNLNITQKIFQQFLLN
jgi:hypothetical protein